MEQRLNILWLVSWYPNRNDAFDGDFIQRHARAAAVHHNIHVIYVAESDIDEKLEEEWNTEGTLTEQLIYFKKGKLPFNRVRKHVLWKRIFNNAVEKYLLANGVPAQVHVQVPWKAGLAGLFLKRKYKLDYFVTEHWGIYNTVVPDNFYYKPVVVRNLLRNIFGKAKKIVSVSKYLGDCINNIVVKKEYTVIPNVTDTTLFYSQQEKHPIFSFIHVSNMVPLKNVKGILDAFHLLVSNGSTVAQLIMVGNKDEEYVKYAQELGLLNQRVFFKGEIPYAAVATEMRKAHCFILNSNIENSPCVIGEALCCGLPVIATKVGGIPEMIDKANGIQILADDPEGLSRAMKSTLDKYSAFHPEMIAANAQKLYSTAVIAQKFKELYQS